MKYILIFVGILFLSACGLTKTNSDSAQTTTRSQKPVNAQNDVLITYTAVTRGSFLNIKIENQILLVKKEQYATFKSRDLSKAEWNHVLNDIDAINLDSLSTLKPPSIKHVYDGAASARLEITKDDMVYSTIEFDHGNPNSEIKPLLEYILSLTEKVE